MYYELAPQFTKIKSRYKVNDIFIVPTIQVKDIEFTNIDLILGTGKCTYVYTNDYKIVYRKMDFLSNLSFIDLETGMNYQDESSINTSSNGEIYIRCCDLIPISRFISKKYQKKSLKTVDLIEIAYEIIADIKAKKKDLFLNINYNNLFLASIYQLDNKIKDKAIVYQDGNKYIDIVNKDTYYSEEYIKQNTLCKYIKNDTLMLLKDFIENSEITDSNKLKKLIIKNNIT